MGNINISQSLSLAGSAHAGNLKRVRVEVSAIANTPGPTSTQMSGTSLSPHHDLPSPSLS